MIRAMLILLVSFFGVGLGPATEHPCAEGKRVSGIIVEGGLGHLFQLEGDPQKYTLSGLHFESRTENVISSGVAVSLIIKNENSDRYGRLAAQAYINNEWLQGQLLQQGKVLADARGLRGTCLAAIRHAERAGETSGAGLWVDGSAKIPAQNLEALAEKTGSLVLIEGQVLSVGNRSRRLYLNFGQKWSEDFTVSVVKKGRGAFKGDIARLVLLKGKSVRVRGILEERQGPLIRLFDEAQIEIID